MYGKHFESMYEGSMYGAGIAVFAVWGYVISHAREGAVELNPRKLKDTLGAKNEKEVMEAIEKLTQPDPSSRCKEHDGRRLLKEGEFQYRVVSWDKYQALKSAEDLREYNRLAKRRERAKKAGMTEKEMEAYLAGKQSEYAKRRKPGVRVARREGQIDGATQAINEGFSEANNEERDYPELR